MRPLREVLKESPDVIDRLSPEQIDDLFSLDRMLARMDPIFDRLEDLR